MIRTTEYAEFDIGEDGFFLYEQDALFSDLFVVFESLPKYAPSMEFITINLN